MEYCPWAMESFSFFCTPAKYVAEERGQSERDLAIAAVSFGSAFRAETTSTQSMAWSW